MKRTSAAFVLAALFAVPAFAAGPLLEKVVEVPRATSVSSLDLAWEKCALVDVETQNDPCRQGGPGGEGPPDPKDLTFLLVRFRYKNADWVDHRVRLRTVLLDARGNVLADAGRTGTLDKNQTDDTMSFPMKIKTVELAGRDESQGHGELPEVTVTRERSSSPIIRAFRSAGLRRGAGVVDQDGLENRFTRKGNVGSNPTLTAI